MLCRWDTKCIVDDYYMHRYIYIHTYVQAQSYISSETGKLYFWGNFFSLSILYLFYSWNFGRVILVSCWDSCWILLVMEKEITLWSGIYYRDYKRKRNRLTKCYKMNVVKTIIQSKYHIFELNGLFSRMDIFFFSICFPYSYQEVHFLREVLSCFLCRFCRKF